MSNRLLPLGPCAALFAGLLPALACTAAPRLNDTGTTACINGVSQFVDCAGTGQDGEFGRDVTHPDDADGRVGFRYTRLCNSGEAEGQGACPSAPVTGNHRNQWGCTRDEVTGLTWEVKTADGGRRDGQRNYTYYSPSYDPDGLYGSPGDTAGFVAAVNEAGLCGAKDWRLPTPPELMGLVDMGITTLPAIDLRFLPNSPATLYWAAGRVYSGFFAEELAWGTDFSFGFGSISAQFRSDQRPVRLVRGAAPAADRYEVSATGRQVTDRSTSLVWRRCLEGQQVVDGGCVGQASTMNWTQALTHAMTQADKTGAGWRLPNLKELASLLDFKHAQHIDPEVFPNQGTATLQWTSSPMLIYRIPRCVDFVNGSASFCNAPTRLAVRLVRDAR